MTKSTRRPGFSFVEVLIATVIVAVGILPVMTMLVSTGDSLRQTAPFSQALFLSTLSLEEARLGAAESPRYVDRLVLEQYGSQRGSVLHGGHPYFRHIEDAKPPYGRIDPDADGSLEPQLGPIYDLVEPLALQLDASRRTATSAEGGAQAEVEILFDWFDMRGKPMNYAQWTPLLVWTPLERVESPGENPASPAPGSARETLEAFLSLGASAEDALATRMAAIQDLDRTLPGGTGPGSAGRRAIREARLHEALTAELLILIQGIKPAVLQMSTGLQPGSLGASVSGQVRQKAVDLVKVMLNGFMRNLRTTLNKAVGASRMEGLTLSERLQAHRIAWRAMVMEFFVRPWPDDSPLRAYLLRLGDFYRHRLPITESDLVKEEQLLSTLPQTYPLRRAAQDYLEVRQNYAQAAINLLIRL